MKKLLYLIAFVALAVTGRAQTVSFTLTTAPCNNDGVLTANATGLTPPLTFNWTTYGSSGAVITHSSATLSDALTSYSGGPINLSVTDGSGTAYNYYAGAPPFTYTTSSTMAVCPTPGTLTAMPFGGTAPYTYQWYNTTTSAIVSTSNPATLPAGGYGVTITDAAGCQYGSLVTSDTTAIYDSNSLFINATSTAANCTNGTATALGVSGAVMPVSYLWSTGATSTTITGLTMGTYSVTATDAVGCVTSRNVLVGQAVSIPVSTSPTPATCLASDGAVIAFGSGGVPPYSYLWSNGATTQSQTGLTAGYYAVTLLDANGCKGIGGANVTAATPITVTATNTPSSCTSPTGTASIAPVGGTLPYNIIWYTTPPQTTTTATSLPAGSHSFKVTDAAGCIRTGAVIVPPINIINASFSATSATCTLSNGGLTVFPVGGTAPYTYSWSTGGTGSSISSVPAGGYNVTITDNIGCSITRHHSVPVFSPMGVGVTSTPASCIFANDGILSATAFGGTAPYSFSWSGPASSTGSTFSGLATGNYWLMASDAMGCTKLQHAPVGYNTAATSCYCTISGIIFKDANGNCVQDAGESGIKNVQVHCTGRGYTYTNASGYYSFMVPSGSYTITETVQAFYPLSTCQSNNIPVTVVAASGCVNTVNFANNVTPIHDMHISTWNYVPPVPGNTYHQVALVSNDGTLTESTVLGGYYADGQIFAPTFTPSGVFTGAPYWYNTSAGFPTLTAGATQTFHINYTVPTTIPMGTSLVFKDSVAWQAPMSTWLTDYTPWNNVNYYSPVVVSSYDPNFKEVKPTGTGAAGTIGAADTLLEYMVHFQNLGTYKAENVVVLDTLDNDLDWTTMRPVYQSHKCKVTMTEVGTYKIARFTFNNIDLPAQIDDDLRSNGMFTYTIKRNPGLAIGTQIKNSASIYFDYNVPVKTNTTLNTIGATSPTKVEDITTQTASSFIVYPNPAQQSFNTLISSDEEGLGDLNVCDVTGKVLISKTIALKKGQQVITTDISQFASGLYIINLSGNGKVQSQKLTVIR